MNRLLEVGEILKEGDLMVLSTGTRWTVTKCKYDPGCCTDRPVTLSEHYERPYEKIASNQCVLNES